jgi:hypothetical protein
MNLEDPIGIGIVGVREKGGERIVRDEKPIWVGDDPIKVSWKCQEEFEPGKEDIIVEDVAIFLVVIVYEIRWC